MRIARIGVAIAVAAGLIMGLSAAATLASAKAPKVSTDTSTNWAGYSLTEPEGTSVSFTKVTATWKQPDVTCSAGEARAAIWVGLGGAHRRAGNLLQIGTNADCRSGKTTYVAFYELIPDPGEIIKSFEVRAGDLMTAAVSVKGGTQVRFDLLNRTANLGFTITLPVNSVVLHSAEWIIEAPAGCRNGVCGQADLANFRSVAFTNVGVVGNGSAGSMLDKRWHTTAVSMIPSRRQIAMRGVSYGAVPKALAADGAAFSLAWKRRTSPVATPGLQQQDPTTKPFDPLVAGPRAPARSGLARPRAA